MARAGIQLVEMMLLLLSNSFIPDTLNKQTVESGHFRLGTPIVGPVKAPWS